MIGQQFGRLTVIKRSIVPFTDGRKPWVCKCECGKLVRIRHPIRTKSCGCLAREMSRVRATKHLIAKTHGLYRTRVHNTWRGMKERCEDIFNIHFSNYGGRNIKVCERWQTFENFFADMGHPPPGFSIDRIDNDKDYEPENCKWASAKEQRINQKRMKRAKSK